MGINLSSSILDKFEAFNSVRYAAATCTVKTFMLKLVCLYAQLCCVAVYDMRRVFTGLLRM